MRAFVTGGAGFVGRALVRLAQSMAGCDAVFHVAGEYRIGIAVRDRPAMYAANVTGTASDAKARRELGYAPRDLETGLRQTFRSSLPA